MPGVRIIFAGGGTGGHLFPALAVADEIKKLEPAAEIVFVGTLDKLEAHVVPQQGYEFRSIWVSGFHRRRLFKNALFPVKLIISIMQARSIIKQFKPAVAVGTGGYVSGPVVYAATLSHIPTVILDQNAYPGITTRLLGNRVNEVHLTFEAAKKYLKRNDNVSITGNPTRSSLDNVNMAAACSYFGFSAQERKRTVLVFGGSLGARSINQAVLKNLVELVQSGIRLIWQTGKDEYQAIRGECARMAAAPIWVNPFIDRMDYAYAVSDLVVCRAGATTISELTRIGKPAILVPYPHAAANHQVHNALELAEAGAAKLLYDHEVADGLPGVLTSLINDEEQLRRMGEASKRFGKPDAGRVIAERILMLAGKKVV
ncbi:MAG: undecaprenyldiphospho-muramoylpentapeptide beta-N-acetylglucosaminyltransferase [Bacteroidota bacterium]